MPYVDRVEIERAVDALIAEARDAAAARVSETGTVSWVSQPYRGEVLFTVSAYGWKSWPFQCAAEHAPKVGEVWEVLARPAERKP